MVEIHGFASKGFEQVRDTFADNFAKLGDIGASYCVTKDGETVVDLWGGYADAAKTRPWAKDTIINVYSTTKTMTALTVLMLADRGLIDFKAPVAKYWPEFAAEGKERVTVRQLLAHQAGLFALDEPVDRSVVADLDRLAGILARQKPAWEPGTRQAYHGITLGY